MASAPKACPCHSGARYAACCGPLHAGTRLAETPEALMRSRYAAFSLGRGQYLVETLSKGHPDRALPAEAFGRAHERQRFLGLSILQAAAEGDHGEVLFYARIFEKGRDVSFAELSTFAREDGAWRYASGVMLARPDLPEDPRALDRETFLRLAGR